MAMSRVRKMALKALSYVNVNIDMKKSYKTHRKVLVAFHPFIKPLYNLLDHKIVFENHEIPVRIFKPKKSAGFKILLFFHGGGWVTGNIDSYTNVCVNMANQTGYVVVSVDYRLAPEYPFPAGLLDCYRVTELLHKDPDIFPRKPKEIILIGDSAGANLAAAVSLMARDKGGFVPRKQILLYPATNNYHDYRSQFSSIIENGTDYILTSKRIQDYMDLYISKEEDRFNPYVAPLLANDLSNQPKTLIITAEYDPLRDEGETYGMRLKEYGNDVIVNRIKDALHGFLTLPKQTPYINTCYKLMNDFLKDNSTE